MVSSVSAVNPRRLSVKSVTASVTLSCVAQSVSTFDKSSAGRGTKVLQGDDGLWGTDAGAGATAAAFGLGAAAFGLGAAAFGEYASDFLSRGWAFTGSMGTRRPV